MCLGNPEKCTLTTLSSICDLVHLGCFVLKRGGDLEALSFCYMSPCPSAISAPIFLPSRIWRVAPSCMPLDSLLVPREKRGLSEGRKTGWEKVPRTKLWERGCFRETTCLLAFLTCTAGGGKAVAAADKSEKDLFLPRSEEEGEKRREGWLWQSIVDPRTFSWSFGHIWEVREDFFILVSWDQKGNRLISRTAICWKFLVSSYKSRNNSF